MTKKRNPTKPTGLGPKATSIWTDVVSQFELRTDELRLLEDACRTVDLIERIEEVIRKTPLLVKGSQGQLVASPLVQEVRQHRATYRALMKALNLPDEDEGPSARTRSVSAREAAQARWRRGA